MISSGRFSNSTVRADMQRDYRELRDLLCIAKDSLGIATDRPAYPPRQIAITLRQLQHRLAVHFTLEEAFGYGEEERLRAPWLSQKAAQLRSEHDHIFARLKTIVKSADQLLEPEPTSSVEEISAMFEDFTIDLRLHEDRDAELLLSIFDDDLGVGD
jgi:iron-sulfur cluster repair protein YtfE (RIC family)